MIVSAGVGDVKLDVPARFEAFFASDSSEEGRVEPGCNFLHDVPHPGTRLNAVELRVDGEEAVLLRTRRLVLFVWLQLVGFTKARRAELFVCARPFACSNKNAESTGSRFPGIGW